jgi:(1->4)-alpha-D-glucan 1-alpha-D-glucosylmutase
MAELKIPRIPVATYRLQFRDGMTFARAGELIPHWKSLGISHLYASPIFAAVSGSTHGYDVTDPNVIDPSLGGIDGFRRFSDLLQAAGLGLILDIVPNHMAASLENPYWRDVLKWGRYSPSAPIFDNHWDRKLTLPVLSGPLEDAIKAGHGKLHWIAETAELVFDYHGSRYPIDPSTYPLAFTPEHRTEELQRLASAAAPHETGALGAYLARLFGGASVENALVTGAEDIVALLESQPWQKIHWRHAAKGLSYRRFFEITGLVGVRVEDPSVFDMTHHLILDLVKEGRAQGLRIDHIDGLADPKAYLTRLRDEIGPDVYLVVEKILEGDEQLPADWPVEGTTGYEFIADLASLLSADGKELDGAWREMAPDFGEPEEELARAKRLMVEVNFEGEVVALIRRAQALARSEKRADIPDGMLADAVRALIAGFDVYRTYGTSAGLSDRDRRVVQELFGRLQAAQPQLEPALSLLQDMLLAEVSLASIDAAAAFRTRLQHLTGPVLAKSLEDTFFYRYNRLIALNEVGGDPIGRPAGIDHFHRCMAARHTAQPHALSATSTHDTKRGEDARARLYAISEAPSDWIALVARWRRDMSGHVAPLADGPAPEPAVEWLLFQALAGMLPHDFDPGSGAARHEIRDRFLPYVEKALREAKLRTNWSDANESYERAVKRYAAAAIDHEPFITSFWHDISPFVRTGLVNSMTQTLIKLTAPGVPDIYQGAEGADTSLVDPDNRRMPDYKRLAIPAEEPSSHDFPAAKSWLIRRTLGLRGHYPRLFTDGDYVPLESSGERKDNILAFARRLDGDAVVVAVPRLVHAAVSAGTLLSPAYWKDTTVKLPEGVASLRNVLDSAEVRTLGRRLVLAELFRKRSFALLVAGA